MTVMNVTHFSMVSPTYTQIWLLQTEQKLQYLPLGYMLRLL